MDKAVSARSIILAAVTVALMVSIVPVGEADADTVVQDTIYCYGDHIVLMPLYPVTLLTPSSWMVIGELPLYSMP